MAELKYRRNTIKVHSDTDYDNIGPNDVSLQSRCDAYVSDEPKTLEWLNTFKEDSIFYDIGSNIGGFSFIAKMLNPSLKVYSFETNFMNFYTQVKTCKENNIEDFFVFNVAVNDSESFDTFRYSHASNGGDGSFGDKLREKMKKSKYENPFTKKNSNLEVGMLGITLDSLVYNHGLPAPDYCKLDVDGNELLVLRGASRVLKESRLKEIFVEVDDDIYEKDEIDVFLRSCKFSKKSDINVGTKEKPIRMALYVKR